MQDGLDCSRFPCGEIIPTMASACVINSWLWTTRLTRPMLSASSAVTLSPVQNHFRRLGCSHNPRQSLGAAKSRYEAQFYLRQTE